MPGASSARESRRSRNDAACQRAVKRSASSAAGLRRSRSSARDIINPSSEVVATGYTPVNDDLPPVNQHHYASETHLNADHNHPRTKNTTATRSSSDRQVRFQNDSSENDRRSFHESKRSSSSASSSGVSSASSSPHLTKPRVPHKRSASATRYQNHLHPHDSPRSSAGKTLSSSPSSSTASPDSSPSTSPSKNSIIDEDDVTCAICLDLLHRPRSLPCGHTFCLVCLQNYANSCRTIITCPSCRGAAYVPKEGVMGLPANTTLAEMAQIVKDRKHGKLSCIVCNSITDTSECNHCKQAFCSQCGGGHAKQIQLEVAQLAQRLTDARENLSCQVEEDETRFRNLEDSIEEVVEDRVAKLHEDCRKLQVQVEEIRRANQLQVDTLSSDIDQVLQSYSSQTNQQMEWNQLSQLHANIKRLLKATTNNKGPRVTLNEETLTLSASSSASSNLSSEGIEDNREDDDDDRLAVSQDHGLIYRRKGTFARIRLGQHLVERPAGVAVNPHTSDIYVTVSDTCRVYMFDSSGRQIGCFGSRGHNDGQFLCPIGLAFSFTSNEIFITDKWKHCIHVFDTQGNFLRQLGRKGKGYGHFSSPEGIATDKHGQLYVADTCNNRVQVLDRDGVFLREVGVVTSETLGDGFRYTKSEFNEPTGVASSFDGSKIYVADAGNHRIKVFDGTTGERLLMFGSRGKHKGQFESPESIVVDPEGFILIGDSGNGRVQIFRPNGNFVRFLGSRGQNHGEFGWVSGISLSKSLDVVVTDFKNNIVAIF